MPIIPQPCREKGCYQPVYRSTSFCKQHQRNYVSNQRKERLPPPREWERIRQAKFQEWNWVCYMCLSNDPPADTIDHIKRGDDHSWENLAPVHDRNAPHCHRSKTGREGAASRSKRSHNSSTYWQDKLNDDWNKRGG